MNTLTTTINYAQPYIGYSPLTDGVALNPAISVANMILCTILNAPNTFGFNRNENVDTETIAETQDYDINISDLNFIERVTLTDTNGKVWEVPKVMNYAALSVQATQGRPQSVCLLKNNFAGNNTIRFSLVPDAVYTINITYQKIPVLMAALTDGWSGIPDIYQDIYNNLFLAEAYAVTLDDASATKYRARGMAALLAKSEGLTEMLKNLFLDTTNETQAQAAQLAVTQATQARAQ